MTNRQKPLLTLTRKDFIITYYSGSGAGGQHRNKHQNCVRIHHQESGVAVSGTEQKSRTQNQATAFKRLTDNPKFRSWLTIKSIHEEEILKKVKLAMQPENLKIEVFKDKKWTEEDSAFDK